MLKEALISSKLLGGSGGGGGGFFGEANVTIIATGEGLPEGGAFFANTSSSSDEEALPFWLTHFTTQNNPAKIPLYNGTVYMFGPVNYLYFDGEQETAYIYNINSAQYSGNIALVDGVVVITGDCTITAEFFIE